MAPDCSWLLPTAPGCPWLLLAASGCSWLLLATPGCAWRLLATPLAATIHASTDSWGRNFHMTQNISLITVFGHCAPGTRWILSRATLNHPYRRCALVDPLQSHVDARLSWPPPHHGQKSVRNDFQETSFANWIRAPSFVFFWGSWAINIGCCGRTLPLLPSCYSVAIQLLFQLLFSC